MPFAPVNGIQLYYEVHGSGPPVLFAHGQGGNHLSWWQQIPAFAKHYTCITFDHRAFGASIDIDGKGRAGFAGDAIGLLDHLGVEKAHVVAHSMGGRSAIAVALRATDRCRSVVLAGTNGGIGDETVRLRQGDAALARGGKGLGNFSVAPGYRESHPEMYFLLRQISAMNPPRASDFLHPVGPMLPPAPQPLNPQRLTVHERLNLLGLPVLFIVGEHDAITPQPVVEACHALVPHSRMHVVYGSGHSAYWEKPDEFNEVALSFLLEVDAHDTSAK